jgi:hypothetical protein
MGSMADTSAPSRVGWFILGAIVGGILGGVAVAMAERQSAGARPAAGKGPGYYVLQYNYPPRHRDRRLKGYAGPFASRRDAQSEAVAQGDVWYTTVRSLQNDPFTTERLHQRTVF